MDKKQVAYVRDIVQAVQDGVTIRVNIITNDAKYYGNDAWLNLHTPEDVEEFFKLYKEKYEESSSNELEKAG